jgi:peptide chain release factor 1
MKDSIRQRLMQVAARYEEVGLLLSDPSVFSEQDRFRELSREYAQLEPIVASWEQWLESEGTIGEASQMLEENDPEMRQMAADELREAEARRERLEKKTADPAFAQGPERRQQHLP